MKSESPSSAATARTSVGGAALDPAECTPPTTARMPYLCVCVCVCACVCMCMHEVSINSYASGQPQGIWGKLLTHGVNSCSRRRQGFVKRGTTAERDDVSEASQCLTCVYASRGCETNARRDPGRAWRNKVKRRQVCGERLGGAYQSAVGMLSSE